MEAPSPSQLQPHMLTTAALSDVVQRLTGRPGLAVTDWQVRPFHGGIAETTGDVVRVWGTGHGQDGARSWLVVLKLVRPTGGRADGTRFDY